MAHIINNIKQIASNVVATVICIFVGVSILNMMSNKKGMLANLIGGFIVILVGLSLVGPIAQEINNIADCQVYNVSIDNETIVLTTDAPIGSTGSFGGGGSSHFGGYDGTVKHNSFVDALASTSFIKSDRSMLDPECKIYNASQAGATVLKLVPMFFAIAILLIAIMTIASALRSGGLI
jgi:hypothetical protein